MDEAITEPLEIVIATVGWCDVFGPICLECFDRYLDYREAMAISGGPLPYAFFEWDDGPGTVPR